MLKEHQNAYFKAKGLIIECSTL